MALRSRSWLATVCFAALLLLVTHQTVRLFAPFAQAICWGGILAFMFHPAYLKLRSRWKLSNNVAALLMTALLVVVVVPPLIALMLKLAEQSAEWVQSAARYIEEGHVRRLLERMRDSELIWEIERWPVFRDGPGVSAWLSETARGIGNRSVAGAGQATKNALGIAVNGLLSFWMVFEFLRNGDRLYAFFYRLLPLTEQTKRVLFDQIDDTLSAVIRGQLLTAASQGVCAWIVYAALGLPYALLLGVITSVAALVPVVGAGLVWAPLAAALAVHGQPGKALLLCALGVGVIGLVDNFLRPLLARGKTRLSYILLLFAMLGGIEAYGAIGVFLGPILLSLFFALTTIYQREYLSP